MKLEVKQNCPLNDFSPCKQFDCAWFMKMTAKNPNDGKLIEEWNVMRVACLEPAHENAQQSRQTGAAVESFRNEMVEVNKASNVIAAMTAKAKSDNKLIEM